MQDHVLCYYVFDPARGWLSFDEKTWTRHFYAANEFNDLQLANDIGERQTGDKQTFYVMACMGSM